MNKHIENLGKKLRAYAYDMKLNDNDDCQNVADFIITTLGYRKAEDVAREIFAEIEGLMWDAVIGGKYPAKVINPDKFAELKKKYESEGANSE